MFLCLGVFDGGLVVHKIGVAVAPVLTDSAASLHVGRPPFSGLEPGERAVRELVDRVHLGQDRVIVRHYDGAVVLGLHFLADQLGDLLAADRV